MHRARVNCSAGRSCAHNWVHKDACLLPQAAKTLEDNGAFRVTVLEATSRVGGRAKAALVSFEYCNICFEGLSPFQLCSNYCLIPVMQLADGQRAELGATWLHGSKGHPVYELAVKYGIMPPDLKKGESRLFCPI